MVTVRCPTCSKEFDHKQTSVMPFCSERCRQIDLARWLDERHGLPHEPKDDYSEEEPAAD